MKPTRILTLAALALAAIGGCQSIAGVEEVEFLGEDAVSPECNEYCDLVLEACEGDKSVYEDRDSCMAACAAFDTIDPSTEANTLACRLEQARNAANVDEGDNLPHCLAAGPGGGSICVSNQDVADCEGYCSLVLEACPSISMKLGFLTVDECVPKCALIRRADSYSVATAADTGDTLDCRLFYTSRALVDPSEFNCMSARLYPDFGCKPPAGPPDCDFYCDLVQATCIDEFKVYETLEQCKQVCLNTPPGMTSDAGGQDTVGCRTYHAYNAMTLAYLPHCSHSGPAGNGVCSVTDATSEANCTPYCRLAHAGCKERFEAQWDTESECIEDCSTLDGGVPDKTKNGYNVTDATRGNTVQCRILHAARALEKPDDKDIFCDGVFGEAPCNED